ncbi:MAG: DUF5719 family protein [Candidatus Geothermincolia bacterium]
MRLEQDYRSRRTIAVAVFVGAVLLILFAFSCGAEAATTTRAWAHDAAAVGTPSTTWYLAEGCTAEGFETWVLVQNPGSKAASVKLTYMSGEGVSAGPSFALAPFSRKTVNVADTLPGAAEVSTVVTSDNPVVVERAMYGSARRWATDTAGITEPGTEWYLAEGSTGTGFETWVLVQNPLYTTATVTLTYMTDKGERAGPTFKIPAYSRKTINVADTVKGAWSVSTRVASTGPVVVERAMYGDGRAWAHASAGVTEPAQTWYLAEGSTAGGNQTWVLVQNPQAQKALVELTYMTPAGAIDGQSAWLEPFSRQSFFASDAVPETWEVSTLVKSNRAVVVERAMYGADRAWATGAAGATGPATDWYLAEGSTGAGFETWVPVQNPGDAAATVSLTYMTDDGKREGPSFELAPNTRKTVNVAETVPGTWNVSTRVESDTPVVVERAVYGDRKSSIGELTLMEGTAFETIGYVVGPGGSSVDMPTLMVMGGVHGDEDAGYRTAEKLTRALVSKGRLVVLPRADQPAIAAHTRQINKDLNRCFPGIEKGVNEDRLAWEIMELARTNDIDMLLNLHSAEQFNLLDPSALGQTIVFDTAAIMPDADTAAGQANTSLSDPVERFAPLVKPIPTSATYEVYYRQGKPAYGIEACEKLDLGRQCYDELLVIKAFAEQVGVVVDNWDELLR